MRAAVWQLKLPLSEKPAEGLAGALGGYGSLAAVLRAEAQERMSWSGLRRNCRSNGVRPREWWRIVAALQAVAMGGRQKVEEVRKAAEAAVRSVRREAAASLPAVGQK